MTMKDFRRNAGKKDYKYQVLRSSSRTSQLSGKGPLRGREME